MTLKLRSVGASDRGLDPQRQPGRAARGCLAASRSPTAWAAWRPATWPAGSRSTRSPRWTWRRRRTRLVAALQDGDRAGHRADPPGGRGGPGAAGHGHHAHRAALRPAPAAAWRWPTSATPAPTCCREGVLEQVTRDDTFVQMLVDQGVITPEEASSHPGGRWSPRRCRASRSARRTRRWCPGPGTAGCCAATASPTWSAPDTLTEMLGDHRDREPARAADRPGAAGRRPGQHHRRRRRRRRGDRRRQDGDRGARPAAARPPGPAGACRLEVGGCVAAPAWRGRGRVLRPGVPRVAAAQLGPYLRVAGAPERRQVGGDGGRAAGGREQVQQHGHPAVGEPRRVAASRTPPGA